MPCIPRSRIQTFQCVQQDFLWHENDVVQMSSLTSSVTKVHSAGDLLTRNNGCWLTILKKIISMTTFRFTWLCQMSSEGFEAEIDQISGHALASPKLAIFTARAMLCAVYAMVCVSVTSLEE